MTPRPRHFASLQYAILATFLIAVWYTILEPFDQALEQIKFMLLEESTRTFFACFAIGTVGAVILCALFGGRRAEEKQFARLLAIASIGFFGLAVWQFSQSLIFGFGLGSAFAIWGWKSSKVQFDADALHRST
jgi:hypothetical protein